MKLVHLLLTSSVLCLLPHNANAQARAVGTLRDSLAAVTDVPLLYRLERAHETPGAARTIEPLVRRGVIALRIYELTQDRADADRARAVTEAATQRFASDARGHFAYALALAYGPDVRLSVPGGALDNVVVGQTIAEIFKRDPKSRARRALRRALELDRGFADAAVLLGQLALADGGRSRELIVEARDALTAVAAAGGSSSSSERALAEMEIALGNYAAASGAATGEDAASLRARAIALLLQPGSVPEGTATYWRAIDRLTTVAATDFFYADVEVLVTPAEAVEWRAADVNGRRAWIERFWDRRAAEGGVSTAERIAEHYRRFTRARTSYVRNSTRGLDGAGVLLTDRAPDRHVFDDRGVLLIRHGDPVTIVRTAVRGLLPNETWVYDLPAGRQLFHLVALRGSQNYSLVDNALEALDPRLGGGPGPDLGERQRAVIALLADRAPYEPRYQTALGRLQRILQDPLISLNDTEIRSILERTDADYRRGARAAMRTDSHVRRYTGDLAFHHDVFTFRTPEARTELTAAFAIPARDLGAATAYDLRLAVIVIDTLIGVVTRADSVVRITPARPLAEGDYLRTYLTLPVLPSPHTIYRVVAEDMGSGRGAVRPGSAPVRDYLGSSLLISDVVLSHPDSAGGLRRGDLTISPALPRAFAPERPFAVFYELYNLPADQPYTTRIVVRALDRGSLLRRMIGGTGPVVDVRFDDVARPDANGNIQEVRRLASDLPAGSYRIEVTVTTASGQTARTASLFTVEG